MKNDTGSDLLLVNKDTGEVFGDIKKDNYFNEITEERHNANENYKETIFCVHLRGEFIKIMKDNGYLLRVLKDKKYLTYVILYLIDHIQPKTNYLVKEDGSKLKQTEIAKELNVSVQMIVDYIKDLKKMNIVQTIKTKDGQFLAINPNVANNSETVLKSTLKEFEK